MLSEISGLVDGLVPDWACTLPSHVAEAYSAKGSRPLAAPVIRVLLDAIRFPGAAVLEHELTMPTVGSFVEVDPVHLLPTGVVGSVDDAKFLDFRKGKVYSFIGVGSQPS